MSRSGPPLSLGIPMKWLLIVFLLSALPLACDSSTEQEEEEITNLDDAVDLEEETSTECTGGSVCGGSCPGLSDEVCACRQGTTLCLEDGRLICTQDDGTPARAPGEQSEVCENGLDDDCDGEIDEGCETCGLGLIDPSLIHATYAKTDLVLPDGFTIAQHPTSKSATFHDEGARVFGFVILTPDAQISPEESISIELERLALGRDERLNSADDNSATVTFQSTFRAPDQGWQITGFNLPEKEGVRVRATFSYGPSGTNPLSESRDPAKLRDAIISSISGVYFDAHESGTECQEISSAWLVETRPDGGLLTSGVVACKASMNEQDVAHFFEDLSSGTLTAPVLDDRFRPESPHCETQPVELEQTKVDFLWIIDNSGSMADEQMNLAGAANLFFNRLVMSQIDWRMAVSTTEAYAVVNDPWDMVDLEHDELLDKETGLRGVGFLSAGELDALDLFQSYITYDQHCVKLDDTGEPVSPIDSNICGSGLEDGLLSGVSVLKLLESESREDYRLRSAAKPVVIWVSDEESQSFKPDDLSTPIGADDPRFAPLIDDFVDEYRALGATTYAIVGDSGVENGGICEPLPPGASSIHGAQPGKSYSAVAQRTGGGTASVCSEDFEEALKVILDGAIGSTASYPLLGYPIASTIKIAVNGLMIPRSDTNGWQYDANANAIIFFGVGATFTNGAVLQIDYLSWE